MEPQLQLLLMALISIGATIFALIIIGPFAYKTVHRKRGYSPRELSKKDSTGGYLSFQDKEFSRDINYRCIEATHIKVLKIYIVSYCYKLIGTKSGLYMNPEGSWMRVYTEKQFQEGKTFALMRNKYSGEYKLTFG